jgi:hypothetical protein
MRRLRFSISAALVAAASIVALASPAVASTPAPPAASMPAAVVSGDDGVAIAVAGTPGGIYDSDCMTVTGGIACFQRYGDKVWVKHTGSTAAAASYENYLWDGGAWSLYRWGYCYNSLAAGKWGYCNKDFYEDQTNPNAYGSKGSGVRLYVCLSSCSAGYVWVRNNE